MSPTEIAAARVLRAWLDWPGDYDAGLGGTMRDVGDALVSAGLATDEGGVTADGVALLERHDAGAAS